MIDEENVTEKAKIHTSGYSMPASKDKRSRAVRRDNPRYKKVQRKQHSKRGSIKQRRQKRMNW